MKSYERGGKTAGADYFDLAFRGLTFVLLDCMAWLLEREEDGQLNVFDAPKGFSTILTGQEPLF